MNDTTTRYPRTSTKRHKIAVIEGPNQTNQGNRSKSVYGDLGSLTQLQNLCIDAGDSFGVEVRTFVSNAESEILEYIHTSSTEVDAYIINPAGMTVHGIPAVHALYETGLPFVEVHMANVQAAPPHPRAVPIGPWSSAFTPHVTGLMMGLREHTYVGAVLSLTLALDDKGFLGDPNWNK